LLKSNVRSSAFAEPAIMFGATVKWAPFVKLEKEIYEEMNAPQSNDYHAGSSRSFRLKKLVNHVNPVKVERIDMINKELLAHAFKLILYIPAAPPHNTCRHRPRAGAPILG
jgi:hypothetical protein